MKITLRKLTCLALTLALILAASGAMATQLTLSSALWETRFLSLLAYAAENGLPLAESTEFTVTPFTAPNGETGYEHTLELAGYMQAHYYDGGEDDFDVSILSIHLDHGDAPIELALMALYFSILSVDPETTQEEFNAVLDAVCPIFGDVYTGEQRVNGMQAATMRGVGYAMEIDDDARFMYFYANVWLSQDDE